MKDHRKNQKVVRTFTIEDQGQDFTELDLLENGVILGYSPIFANGRTSAHSAKSKDKPDFVNLEELKTKPINDLKGFQLLIKETEAPKPKSALDVDILRYAIIGEEKVEKPNKFINDNK